VAVRRRIKKLHHVLAGLENATGYLNGLINGQDRPLIPLVCVQGRRKGGAEKTNAGSEHKRFHSAHSVFSSIRISGLRAYLVKFSASGNQRAASR